MYLSNAIIAASALMPLVSAHGGAPVPNIAGLNIKDLKARSLFSDLRARAAAVQHTQTGSSNKRQNAEGRCGPGIASCAAGQCCSEAGCMTSHVPPSPYNH